MANEDKSAEQHQCEFGENDAIIPGPSIPGGMLCIHHSPNHDMELGALIKLEDGVPIPENARLVHEENGILKVSPPLSNRSTSGPVQVATPSYREGYDRIFGHKPVVGLA